jgi:hypothetical protein
MKYCEYTAYKGGGGNKDKQYHNGGITTAAYILYFASPIYSPRHFIIS